MPPFTQWRQAHAQGQFLMMVTGSACSSLLSYWFEE